ncbi:MAG: hypothetical protein WC907_04865 [Acholeplasmataceae bacterium]
MSMTQCTVCNGTINCSGWDWAACCRCGAPVHTKCDPHTEDDEFLCSKCRGQQPEIKDENGS